MRYDLSDFSPHATPRRSKTSFATFPTTTSTTGTSTSIDAPPDFDIFPIVAHKSGNGISRLEILMEESATPEMTGFHEMQRLPDIGSNQKAWKFFFSVLGTNGGQRWLSRLWSIGLEKTFRSNYRARFVFSIPLPSLSFYLVWSF